MAHFVFYLNDGTADALLICIDLKQVYFFKELEWTCRVCVCAHGVHLVFVCVCTVHPSAVIHLQTEESYKASTSNILKIPVFLVCIIYVHIYSYLHVCMCSMLVGTCFFFFFYTAQFLCIIIESMISMHSEN